MLISSEGAGPSAQIEEARKTVARLSGELSAARGLLLSLEKAGAPFQVGDIVEARFRDGQWKPAIIREIEPQWGTTVWYRVSARTANGAWSKAAVRVFRDVRAISLSSSEGAGQ